MHNLSCPWGHYTATAWVRGNGGLFGVDHYGGSGFLHYRSDHLNLMHKSYNSEELFNFHWRYPSPYAILELVDDLHCGV